MLNGPQFSRWENLVIVPKFQKQQRGLKDCTYFTCAYMADMVPAIDIFGAMYVDGQVQRNWFKDCLLNTAVVACPRLSERPSRFLETNPPEVELTC